jgi:hypothetical protein
MYKRIDLTNLEGFPLTQNTLDHIQKSFRDTFAGLSALLGDYVIVTGVADLGANYSDGWVAINGELLPFVGGVKAAQIVIEETVVAKEFADGSSKDVWYTRVAKCGVAGGTVVGTFVRLSTIKSIVASLAQLNTDIGTEATTRAAQDALKVAKAGDTMSGNLVVPNAVLGTHAVNKNQLDAAISALVNGAGAALDTLLELAAALGNDPAFATTVAALIAAKVAKTGDTMSGPLTSSSTGEFQGGVRYENAGPFLKQKVFPIGPLDMSVAILGLVDVSAINWKKIRTINVMIRNDDDDQYFTQDTQAVAGNPNISIQLSVLGVLFSWSGLFSTTDFDNVAGGYNRGWVTVTYEA